MRGWWLSQVGAKRRKTKPEASAVTGPDTVVYFPVVVATSDCSLLPSASAQEAITKCHGWGGFNNKPLSLPVLEAAESKVEAPADSMSVESSLLGSQTTVFSRGLSTSEGAGRPLGALP